MDDEGQPGHATGGIFMRCESVSGYSPVDSELGAAHVVRAARQYSLDEMDTLLCKPVELGTAGKSERYRRTVAFSMKATSTLTNRWLATTLHMGKLYEVSRKGAAWARDPDRALQSKLR